MIDTSRYDPHSPKAIGDIVANTEIWKNIQKMITDDTVSNMVLVGPAGCGKSLFLKLALIGRPVLTIECTANAGLRDVRDSIRLFARGSRTPAGHLRWIVFEHADTLTADTQAFLRRMLETTVGSTRFVFECRDAGAITEPILSRTSIINVYAPDETEIIYEIQRRTNFKLTRPIVEDICNISFSNMRSAVLNALAVMHCDSVSQTSEINRLLNLRPRARADDAAWVKWAVETATVCRNSGIDLRDILRLGWPLNTVVDNTCATWPRLGGTSPRTLFFDCIATLSGAAATAATASAAAAAR